MAPADDEPAPPGVQPPPPIYAPLDGSTPPGVEPAAGVSTAPVHPVFLRPGQAVGTEAFLTGPAAAGPDEPNVHLPPGTLPSDDPAAKLWKWWVGPLAVFLALAVATVVGLPLVIVLGPDGATDALEEYQAWLGLVQDSLWIAVAIITPLLAAHYLKPQHLGLRRPPSLGRAIGVFFGTLLLFYLAAAAYSAALGLDDDSNKLLQDTGFGDGVANDIALALLFTVLAPVAEELLFRALLFRSLRDGFTRKFGRRTGIALGALISGSLFGAIHWGGGQDDFLPILMLLGILLALAYQWSGTLYVTIAMHSLNNAIATGANSDPSQPWIYGLIGAGPVLALLLAWALSRFIKRWVRSEPPTPSAPVWPVRPDVV